MKLAARLCGMFLKTFEHLKHGGQFMAKQRRYRALDIIRRVYWTVGMMTCLLGTVILLFVLWQSLGNGLAMMMVAGYWVGAMVSGITLLAFAEIIELAMDTEDNTRQAAAIASQVRLQLSNIEGRAVSSSEDLEAIKDSSKQCQAWLARIGKSTTAT